MNGAKKAYKVNVFGKVITLYLSPEDIVKNVADGILGLEDNSYCDGLRDEVLTYDELCEWVIGDCKKSKALEMYTDGFGWSLPTPKAVKNMTEPEIKEICKVAYEEMYGAIEEPEMNTELVKTIRAYCGRLLSQTNAVLNGKLGQKDVEAEIQKMLNILASEYGLKAQEGA